MARPRRTKTLVADFETSVYEGQDHTEVWAAACVELFTDDVHIFHSIEEQYEYLVSLNSNLIVYYHNLKFDGSFWLDYFLNTLEYKQAFHKKSPAEYDLEADKEKFMTNKSFKYSISDMGQWYTITLKVNNHIIEFRDSLKLLPFSVKKIGNSFGTAHKKLDMEYTGYRYAGCPITEEEQKYIANDVLVVKEALEIMITEGHDGLTIGSCCLHEYKRIIGKQQYEAWFPNVYEIPIDPQRYGAGNAGDYIRKAYKGGWCYLARGKENQIKKNGVTADVNSLYPSMMHSDSGNYYPVGCPTFWKGNYIPEEAYGTAFEFPHAFFFVRVRTRFYLKPDKLPFIQIKNNLSYKGTEMLETSDIYDASTGLYFDKYRDTDGNLQPAVLTMTMTQTDYKLFREHYDLINFEILDGCYFQAVKGLFDDYINKYAEIKKNSKGAKRELAKLFLNNLYGKMATNTNSSFKYAYQKEDRVIGFITVKENTKKPGYIPVGAAITSYARNFTIRAAQSNYYGSDEPGFIYADTDSIHCDLPPEQIKGITVHPKNFCCWKLESSWDSALFVRQKTYIEHVTHEDLDPIEKPYYNVRCAGMPEKCKQLFLDSVQGITHEGDTQHYTQEELEFLSKRRKITDFKVGLKVPGKLLPKRIPGGILLVDTSYEMR